MRIVIDYRPALRARTGVGEHIHQVTSALARTGSDEITVFSSSWKDRVPADACDRAARRADRRSARAGRRAQPRVASAALAADRSARRRRIRHRALTASAAVAVALGGTDRDHSRSAFSVASGAHIGGDSPRLSGSRSRARPPRRSHHRRLAVCRRRSAAPARHCVRSAFPSARTARPSGRSRRLRAGADGYMLFVGTIEPRKNVGGLLDAYARLLARRADAPRLVIAGRAEPDAQRVARCDEPAAARRPCRVPRLRARRSEREALFKGAQVFVLPSFEEGFGIPALEAMSAGVPVVVSNRGALPEVIGDAGLLIDPDDAESLAAALGTPGRRRRSARDLRAPRPRPRAAIHLDPDGARRPACLRRRGARATASHTRPRRRPIEPFTVEMRIGIDARELCGNPTGVGRHLSGLLRAWSTDAVCVTPHVRALRTRERIDAASRRRAARHSGLARHGVGTTRAPKSSKTAIAWTCSSRPATRRRLLLNTPTVVLVHDISFAAHPEWFRWKEGLRRRWLTRWSSDRANWC